MLVDDAVAVWYDYSWSGRASHISHSSKNPPERSHLRASSSCWWTCEEGAAECLWCCVRYHHIRQRSHFIMEPVDRSIRSEYKDLVVLKIHEGESGTQTVFLYLWRTFHLFILFFCPCDWEPGVLICSHRLDCTPLRHNVAYINCVWKDKWTDCMYTVMYCW